MKDQDILDLSHEEVEDLLLSCGLTALSDVDYFIVVSKLREIIDGKAISGFATKVPVAIRARQLALVLDSYIAGEVSLHDLNELVNQPADGKWQRLTELAIALALLQIGCSSAVRDYYESRTPSELGAAERLLLLEARWQSGSLHSIELVIEPMTSSFGAVWQAQIFALVSLSRGELRVAAYFLDQLSEAEIGADLCYELCCPRWREAAFRDEAIRSRLSSIPVSTWYGHYASYAMTSLTAPASESVALLFNVISKNPIQLLFEELFILCYRNGLFEELQDACTVYDLRFGQDSLYAAVELALREKGNRRTSLFKFIEECEITEVATLDLYLRITGGNLTSTSS